VGLSGVRTGLVQSDPPGLNHWRPPSLPPGRGRLLSPLPRGARPWPGLSTAPRLSTTQPRRSARPAGLRRRWSHIDFHRHPFLGFGMTDDRPLVVVTEQCVPVWCPRGSCGPAPRWRSSMTIRSTARWSCAGGPVFCSSRKLHRTRQPGILPSTRERSRWCRSRTERPRSPTSRRGRACPRPRHRRDRWPRRRGRVGARPRHRAGRRRASARLRSARRRCRSVAGRRFSDGIGCPGLRLDGGRISMPALDEALPEHQHGGGAALLLRRSSGRGPTVNAVGSLVDAGRRAGKVVACERNATPPRTRTRGRGEPEPEAVGGSPCSLAPAEVRACVSAGGSSTGSAAGRPGRGWSSGVPRPAAAPAGRGRGGSDSTADLDGPRTTARQSVGA
jgi:hypothetical protein